MEKQQKIKEPNECCSTRTVLWYLVFTGFAVNYMLRLNLNIAIVSMVNARPKDNISLSSECIADILQLKNYTTESSLNFTESTFQTSEDNTTRVSDWESLATTAGALKNDPIEHERQDLYFKFESRKFDWNEKQQGNILGSFFWLHWSTQIAGGILATKYGTKKVFGFSNFCGVLLSFLIPFFAYKGATYLIIIRVIQGLLTGFAWPSMHNMAARWIPPNDRSKFVTAYLGSSVGAALTYPLCGFIIDRWGWELVFYVNGVVGTLWFLTWWILVHDSPADHPRISEEEKKYILVSLGKSVTKAKDQAPIPWVKMMTNPTVIMIILAQWGGVWGLFTMMIHAPTYFKFIHGWNIRATGFLSGMPHLLRVLCAFICSSIGDYLMRSNKMSRNNVRKLATAVCCLLQAVFMIALSFSGCDYNAAIIFLTLAVATHGAVSTGPLASIVDISPNYASVILGLCNTLVALVGFLTPVIVGNLTFRNQTVHQWQIVFWVAAGFLVFGGFPFILFAKSELVSWNSPEKVNGLSESELMVMKPLKKEEKVVKDGYEKV